MVYGDQKNQDPFFTPIPGEKTIYLNYSNALLSNMLLEFINRENELHMLEERYTSSKPEFFIIYGRRRIGKTELLTQFAKDKPHFYFLARKEPIELEAERFRKKFAETFNIYLEETTDFEKIFTQIITKIDLTKKFIFLIDEFPYLIEAHEPILSIFQQLWDEHLNKKNIFLILNGSSVSMMETHVLGYKSPLYGRRTGQLKIEPVPLHQLKKFLPQYTTEEILHTYGAVGAIPFYLNEFNSKKSFLQNIQDTFFNKSNILYQDAEILLKEELREPNTYFNILKTMIDGATKLSEIASKSFIDITNINKYITVLENLKLVRKEYPITQPFKQRNFIYKIDDNYFRFWLSYVYPYKEEIEEKPASVLQKIKTEYPTYMGPIFEDAARKHIKKITTIDFTKLGKWWYKDQEIDLVALNENTKEIVFFECKWKNLRYTQSLTILKELQEKAESVEWQNKKRTEHYGLIAKTIERKNDLRKQGFYVYDLEDWM